MADVVANFGLDTAEYRASIDQVIGRTKEAKAEMEAHFASSSHAAEGLGGAMREVGHEASLAHRAFHHFVAIPGMLSAIGYEAFELGRSIREHVIAPLEGLEEKVSGLAVSVNLDQPKKTLEDAEKVIAELDGKINEIRERQDNATYPREPVPGERADSRQGDNVEELKKQEEELQELRTKAMEKAEQARRYLRTQREREEAKAQADKEKRMEQDERREDAFLRGRENESARYRQEQERERERSEKERDKFFESIGLQRLETQIQMDRLAGKNEEADIDTLRLRTQRDILEIMNQQALTEAEKAQFVSERLQAEQDEKAAIIDKFDQESARPGRRGGGEIFSLSSAGFGNFQQASGGGIVDIGRQHLDATKKTNDLVTATNEKLDMVRDAIANLQVGTWG